MFPQLSSVKLFYPPSSAFVLSSFETASFHSRDRERENIFLTLFPLKKKIYTIIIIREKFLASIISLYILCTFALFHSFQVNLTFQFFSQFPVFWDDIYIYVCIYRGIIRGRKFSRNTLCSAHARVEWNSIARNRRGVNEVNCRA